MPSALSASRPDRSQHVFARWSWSEDWPQAEVVALSGPAIQQSNKLDGAWFIHPSHDVVAALSGLARDIADDRGINHGDVVFYGSSLGGFGAIAAAAHLPGSKAVAEVPQIDFRNWYPGAVKAVEQYALQGGAIESLYERAPERITLMDRLNFAGFIPRIRIISNADEHSIRDQQEFIRWCAQSDLPGAGRQEIEVTTLVSGHKVLPRPEIIARVYP